jgi:tryptophan synthase alpha chain
MRRFTNRFKELKEKKQGAYVPFFVLGDPGYQISLDLIKIAIDNGADALELGFWFSEPIADGPTIQEADLRAKEAGMNVDKAFDLINEIRRYDPNIPMGMLVYYQLVLGRNLAGRDFCADAASAGADAILIPELPIEYVDSGSENIDFHGLDQVLLAAPSTTDERLEKIAAHARGFVYQVARKGVTGASDELEKNTLDIVARTRSYTARYHNTPIVVGFGISRPEHVSSVLKAGADGAITGSALCDKIKANLHDVEKMHFAVREYVKEMKKATK